MGQKHIIYYSVLQLFGDRPTRVEELNRVVPFCCRQRASCTHLCIRSLSHVHGEESRHCESGRKQALGHSRSHANPCGQHDWRQLYRQARQPRSLHVAVDTVGAEPAPPLLHFVQMRSLSTRSFEGPECRKTSGVICRCFTAKCFTLARISFRHSSMVKLAPSALPASVPRHQRPTREPSHGRVAESSTTMSSSCLVWLIWCRSEEKRYRPHCFNASAAARRGGTRLCVSRARISPASKEASEASKVAWLVVQKCETNDSYFCLSQGEKVNVEKPSNAKIYIEISTNYWRTTTNCHSSFSNLSFEDFSRFKRFWCAQPSPTRCNFQSCWKILLTNTSSFIFSCFVL